MGALISFRDGLAKIYRNFDFLFKIIAKFVFVFWCLNYLTTNMGYYEVLNIFSIRLFISVICAFIPPSFVVLIVSLVALVHLLKLSVIFGIVAAVLFLIVYLLYLRFASSQGIFMLAIACLAPFNLHFAVAFFLGLFFSPVTLIPAGLTMVLVEFIKCVRVAAEGVGTEMEIEKILAGYQSIIDAMLSNRNMLVVIVVLAVIIVLTYVIKQLPFDYSWYVAIAVAAIVGIVVLMAGNTVLGASVNTFSGMIGIIIGAVIAVLLQFLSCIVDYPKKQYVQFEDDDYYYYVKAIPKIGKSPLEDEVQEENEDLDEEPKKKKKKKKDADYPEDDSEALFTELAARKIQSDDVMPQEGLDDFYMDQPVDMPDMDVQSGDPATQVFDEGAFDDYNFYTDDDTNLF